MPGRHLPPDHRAGDEATLGGYMAVHGRPAAFEGPDGMPYSADVVTDATGELARPFGAYLLFMRWRRMGPPGVEAHVETDYLAFGSTPAAARARVAGMTLHDVKAHLDAVVVARRAAAGETRERRWWDAMRDE